MKSALEIQNSLLWVIIAIYALRCLTFWYKASGLKEWVDRGCEREEFGPIMLSVFFMIALFFGVAAFVVNYYKWVMSP